MGRNRGERRGKLGEQRTSRDVGEISARIEESNWEKGGK
jgi:hypothetical protein